MKNILTAMLLAALPSCAFAGVSEDTAREMTEFVQEYVMDKIAEEMGDEAHAEVTVSNLEKRLRVEECDGDLAAELNKKDLTRFSNSVTLSCAGGEKEWSAVVPIKIRYTAPAVTVVMAISKNQTITADNVEISYVDKKSLKGNFFTDTVLVVGSKSKRDLAAGSVIRNNQICLVCKDDIVDLEAGTGEVTIKVQARALQDGSLNSNVRVTNLISNKDVTGRVVGVKQVRIDVK
ncbi:MAG: flagellar basal body P-ring formation protein FlgA [Succinivibrionaceae bacterium]|nr:flagellar basal body P-ring formation protein FlgA [Succinivibrionaceae bacterium]